MPKPLGKQNQLNSQRSLRRRWNQAWKTRIHCWSQEKLIETHLFHTSISRILLTYYCNPGHFLDFRASAGAGAKTPGKAKSAEQPEKPKEKVESSMENQNGRFKPGEAHRNTFCFIYQGYCCDFCNPGHFLDSRASAGAGAKTARKAKSAEQPKKPKEKVESSMENQNGRFKPGEAHRNTFCFIYQGSCWLIFATLGIF